MPATAYPTVYAALVTTATTALTGTLRVVDGYDLSADPGDFMLIGVSSLADEEEITAGTFVQDFNGFGNASGSRHETGTINGIVLAHNGQGDQNGARTAAFSYLDTLGDAIRADPALGVSTFTLVAQLASGDVSEDQVDGATCAVSFTVTYTAYV